MYTEYIQKLIGISARFWLEAKNQAKWQIFHAYCGHAKVTKLSRLPLEKKNRVKCQLSLLWFSCAEFYIEFHKNSILQISSHA